MGGHSDLALALANAGYVVAAPNHSGDNGQDETASPAEWLVSRPADMTSVLDFMLSDWRGADRIDPEDIGVFGFSAGGYTALVVAGAVPDLTQEKQHCFDMPDEFLCRIGVLNGLEPEVVEPRIEEVSGDPRVAAISIAAPGLGFAFTESRLKDVKIGRAHV